jgi:hypothetical protein
MCHREGHISNCLWRVTTRVAFEVCKERIVPKFSLALVAVTSVLATLATASVAQTLPPDLPLGIICYSQKSQTWMVGYLQTVNEKGEATYRGQHTATLNADRLVVSPSNRAIVLDCYGKSLDQLRAMGRLIPLQRMPASP